MCGIVGVLSLAKNLDLHEIGNRIVQGLEMISYRGRDSFGLYVAQDKPVFYERVTGDSDELEKRLQDKRGVLEKKTGAALALGHARWATQGPVTEENAQPMSDPAQTFFVAINGQIDNYERLRSLLESKGHKFLSENDSEVAAVLAYHMYKNKKMKLPIIAAQIMAACEGKFAMVISSKEYPLEMVACKRGNMGLSVGMTVSNDEVTAYYPVSDIDNFRKVQRIDRKLVCRENEYVHITKKGLSVFEVTEPSKSDDITRPHGMKMEGLVADIEVCEEKDDLEEEPSREPKEPGYYMKKEIDHQLAAVRNIMRAAVDFDRKKVKLPGLTKESVRAIKYARSLTFLGMGTSYHACLAIEPFANRMTKAKVSVMEATRFIDNKTNVDGQDVVIFVSQSGETADVITAAKYCRDRSAHCIAVTNVLTSQLTLVTGGHCVDVMAGEEISVASTKAYTCQCLVLALLLLQVNRKVDEKGCLVERAEVFASLEGFDRKVEHVLHMDISPVVQYMTDATPPEIILSGRGEVATALEAALKIKEICYLHCEGMSCSCLKHGPLALITEGTKVLFTVSKSDKELYEVTRNSFSQIKARKGLVFVICTSEVANDFKEAIIVPTVHYALQPILSIIPLQRVALEVALCREINPDKPRNLAKSVTVE